MSHDYMPRRDADVLNWMNTFARQASENEAELGMAADETAELQAQATAVEKAIQAVDAACRQYRAAVAAKEDIRRRAEAAFRRQARILQARPATTDAQRQALGLSIRDRRATSVPAGPDAIAQLTRPRASVDTSQRLQHVLILEDSDQTSRRRRPPGVIACEIFTRTGESVPWQYLDHAYERRHIIRYEAARAGVNMQYQCRWVYKGGIKGPWGEVVAATVVG